MSIEPTSQADLVGVLFIGDPHLASRVPGFRKDDYPRVILEKLRYAFNYAREQKLLPVLLGDLFDFPRDNANWLLVELTELLPPQTLALYGNHDCKENTPTANDSISVLIAAGRLRLLSAEQPWAGQIGGCRVIIGGTCWGQPLPKTFDRTAWCESGPSHVLWATHHDLQFPGYDAARTSCKEIPGIDLVVNGHIHRDLGEVAIGATRWRNPGNIARVSRSDACRAHVPGVLRVEVSPGGLAMQRIVVPSQPFDEVFHPEVASAAVEVAPSVFVAAVAKLMASRTDSGLGLMEFLDSNLAQYDAPVAAEIRLLATEVLHHDR